MKRKPSPEPLIPLPENDIVKMLTGTFSGIVGDQKQQERLAKVVIACLAAGQGRPYRFEIGRGFRFEILSTPKPKKV